MHSNKRHLNVIHGTTCFAEHQKHKVNCMKKSCKNWINYSNSQNCVLIGAQEGKRTLENIGQMFNLTRMRICQIIKDSKEKMIKVIN